MVSRRSRMARVSIVAVASALLSAAGGAAYPYLILYLHFDAHLATPVAGLVVGSEGVATLVGALVGGALIDRFGARKVAAGGSLVDGVGALLLLSARSLPEFFLASIVFGFSNVRYPARNLAVAASLPKDLPVGKYFSYEYMLVNAGFATGVLTGGLLIHLADPSSYRHLLLAVAVACLVATLAYTLLPAARPGATHEVDPTYREALRDPALVRYLGFSFMLSFVSYASFDTGLAALVGIALHQSTRVVAVGMVTDPIVIVLGQRPIYALVTRLGMRRTVILTTWCFGASWLVLLVLFLGRGQLYDEIIVAVFALVFALGEMAFSPVRTPLLLALAPERLRGRYSGLGQFARASANVVAPVVATEAIGHRAGAAWLPGLAVLAGGAGLLGTSVVHRIPAAPGEEPSAHPSD